MVLNVHGIGRFAPSVCLDANLSDQERHDLLGQLPCVLSVTRTTAGFVWPPPASKDASECRCASRRSLLLCVFWVAFHSPRHMELATSRRTYNIPIASSDSSIHSGTIA